MDTYKFKATNLIAEAFEAHDVKFDVRERKGIEQIRAGFAIDCGPNVIMCFISCDNDNDVAARILSLISNIPKAKQARILEACNILNNKVRYLKFCLDCDGSIDVEYDLPIRCTDEGLGEIAFEIFVRAMKILDAEYSIFMKALYTNEELNSTGDIDSDELASRLEELRKMMEAEIADAENSSEEDEDDCDDSN